MTLNSDAFAPAEPRLFFKVMKNGRVDLPSLSLEGSVPKVVMLRNHPKQKGTHNPMAHRKSLISPQVVVEPLARNLCIPLAQK